MMILFAKLILELPILASMYLLMKISIQYLKDDKNKLNYSSIYLFVLSLYISQFYRSKQSTTGWNGVKQLTE